MGVGRGLDRKGDYGRSLVEGLAGDGGYDPDPQPVILLVGGSGSLALCSAPLRPGKRSRRNGPVAAGLGFAATFEASD